MLKIVIEGDKAEEIFKVIPPFYQYRNDQILAVPGYLNPAGPPRSMPTAPRIIPEIGELNPVAGMLLRGFLDRLNALSGGRGG